ncbi:hypothetical protein HNP84_001982 [Thermocatellispora tengchongensis]|uniref:Uncharacterized protein n=1 Tax=Thermocatellispora tengchongensis TaxID=1073253 RepID=A0A840P1C3_9ACTN|nr:hypothetical protein [Thermocatellispora tengchongensis]MBB5132266.1 hypothetical protein [Thermocatellispora tengchongensis]
MKDSTAEPPHRVRPPPIDGTRSRAGDLEAADIEPMADINPARRGTLTVGTDGDEPQGTRDEPQGTRDEPQSARRRAPGPTAILRARGEPHGPVGGRGHGPRGRLDRDRPTPTAPTAPIATSPRPAHHRPAPNQPEPHQPDRH